MAAPPPFRPEAILELTRAGRFAEADARLKAHLASHPRDADALLLAAQLEIMQGRLEEAMAAIQRALRGGAPQARANLLRAMVAQLRGETDNALSLADGATRGPGAAPEGAAVVRAEALFAAGRTADFAKLMTESGAWTDDPRVAVLKARAEISLGLGEAAERRLRGALADGTSNPLIRRTAGFELVKLLDRSGRYDDAFDLASSLHRETTRPFDIDGMVAALRRSATLAESGALARAKRASNSTPLVALVAALPRSGTTLVEQMLDCHSKLRGVGELTGVQRLMGMATAQGGWPDGLLSAPSPALDAMQGEYLTLSRTALHVPKDAVSLDKTLLTWTALPAIAAVLPGARILRIHRDPRDNAVSLFLSAMHPFTMGWTGSLDSIRRVIAAEREFVPRILAGLGMPACTIRYEELVDDPRGHLERMLAFLGLPFEEACLTPEANRRAILTLSADQVRRPVNRDSIGRWQRYARHFGPEWETLAKA